MNAIKFSLLALMVLAITGVGCKKDDPKEPDPKTELTRDLELLATAGIDGHTLSIYSEKALIVGYNELFLLLEDADLKLVAGYSPTIMPMMDMGTMEHSAPFESCTIEDAEHGYYRCAVVFTMPSTAGDWTLKTTVNIGGSAKEVSIATEVIEASPARMLSFVSAEAEPKSYFIALVQPDVPKVGENDLVLGIYRKESMMAFPEAGGLDIDMEPWMPSMSHGSMNNVDPVQQSDGLYKGVVNFSMTGDWEIKLRVKNSEGDTLGSELKFDISI